jgi:hypothetical protein
VDRVAKDAPAIADADVDAPAALGASLPRLEAVDALLVGGG